MRRRLSVLTAVLRDPVLRRVESAFLLFSIAEWATWLAIVVFAFGQGGATEAGVVAFVIFVPSIVVAPAASTIGDRYPRARMLLGSYVIQAVTMACTAVAVAVGPPLVAYMFATLVATSITLTRPANGALLPEIVATPDELTAANATTGTVEGAGALIGPLVAGALIGIAGPWLVYGATALGAVIAALAVLPLARSAPPVPAPAAGSVAGLRSVRAITRLVAGDVADGARAIGSDRRLASVFAVLAGSIALLGALNVLYAVLAIELLGLPDSAVGYLAAASGLGAMFGAAASLALVGRERLGGPLIGAAVLFAGAVVVVALVSAPIAAAFVLLGTGAGWAFVYVSARTLTQRLAGDDVMSRVFGFMEATMMASQALGALAVPLLVAAFGAQGAIIAAGLAPRHRRPHRNTDDLASRPRRSDAPAGAAGAPRDPDVRSPLRARARMPRRGIVDRHTARLDLCHRRGRAR